MPSWKDGKQGKRKDTWKEKGNEGRKGGGKKKRKKNNYRKEEKLACVAEKKCFKEIMKWDIKQDSHLTSESYPHCSFF